MRIVHSHQTTRQAAKDTVKSLLPELMSRFGDSVSDSKVDWHNDTARFSGRVFVANIKGTLEVTDTELVLDVDGIPFFLHNKARTGIEQWFNHHWNG